MAIQRESAELASVVEESVSGIRVVKGFGAEQGQAERLGPRPTTSIASRWRRRRSGPPTCRRWSSCPTSAWSRCSATAATRCSTGRSSLGVVVAFNVYVVLLIWPLRMLGMIIAQAQRSAASGPAGPRDPRHRPAVADPARARSPAGAGRPAPAARSASRASLRLRQRRAAGAVDGFDLVVAAG